MRYILLITSLLFLGSFAQAQNDLALVYLDSALLAKDAGDYQSGLAYCNESIALDSTQEKGYFYRAGFHVTLIAKVDAMADYGHYKGAVADYTKVLALNPKHAEACFMRGGAHSEMGFIDQAIEDYEASLVIDDQQPKVYNSLAVCFARYQDPAKGLAYSNQAIALDENYAKAYANRGNINDMLGNGAEACADWQRAIELGYFSAQRQYNLRCK